MGGAFYESLSAGLFESCPNCGFTNDDHDKYPDEVFRCPNSHLCCGKCQLGDVQAPVCPVCLQPLGKRPVGRLDRGPVDRPGRSPGPFYKPPVTGEAMLRFLRWISSEHPEIRDPRSVPVEELLKRVSELDGGTSEEIPGLREKWALGFRFLFESPSRWEGYGEARRFLSERWTG